MKFAGNSWDQLSMLPMNTMAGCGDVGNCKLNRDSSGLGAMSVCCGSAPKTSASPQATAAAVMPTIARALSSSSSLQGQPEVGVKCSNEEQCGLEPVPDTL